MVDEYSRGFHPHDGSSSSWTTSAIKVTVALPTVKVPPNIVDCFCVTRNERCQRKDRARADRFEEKCQAHFQCEWVKNNMHNIARGC